MKEKTVVKNILAYLVSQGGFWFKVHGHPGQLRGVPDIIGCYRSRFIALEVKTPKTRNNVSKIQQRRIDQITKAEGYAFVVTSVDEAREIIEGINDVINRNRL